MYFVFTCCKFIVCFFFTVENINTRTLNTFTRNSAKAIRQQLKHSQKSILATSIPVPSFINMQLKPCG